MAAISKDKISNIWTWIDVYQFKAEHIYSFLKMLQPLQLTVYIDNQ